MLRYRYVEHTTFWPNHFLNGGRGSLKPKSSGCQSRRKRLFCIPRTCVCSSVCILQFIHIQNLQLHMLQQTRGMVYRSLAETLFGTTDGSLPNIKIVENSASFCCKIRRKCQSFVLFRKSIRFVHRFEFSVYSNSKPVFASAGKGPLRHCRPPR